MVVARRNHPNLLDCFAGMVTFFIYKRISGLQAIRPGGITATIAVRVFAAAANYLPEAMLLKCRYAALRSASIQPVAIHERWNRRRRARGRGERRTVADDM